MLLKSKELIISLLFFILTYLIIYFFSFFGVIGKWKASGIFLADYTSFLMPLVGFFMAFYFIEFAANYFNTKFLTSIYFPFVFFVVALVAFWFAVTIFYWNIIYLNKAPFEEVFKINFWGILYNSAFLVFVLSFIAGLFFKLALNKLKEIM